MTRESPRRPSSSRAPVSRPRRVAGRSTAPEPATEPATEPETEPETEPADPAEVPSSDADSESASQGLGALFDSPRASRILVSLVAVLALAAGGLFAWDALRGEEPTRPSTQPVLIGSDDATAAVDEAAKAAETIVATSYQDYDQQVDEATALMTDGFAKDYRRTAEDIKPDFVSAKTVIEARVVAQGVVHATRTEVQALVFLNQYVTKDGGDTTYTPYRALVTVVHTDRGWLVSALDTK